MKTIKILGTGCANCNTTEKLIEKIAKEENIPVNLLKVNDIQEIMEYDVMSTPAVVIDDKVIIKGRVPSVDEVKEFISLPNESSSNDSDDSCCSPQDPNSSSSSCS